LQEIANYFSEQNPPYAAPQNNPLDKLILERGQQLVRNGDLKLSLPACTACHSEKMTGLAPFIPGLLGLPRDYLVSQIGAWQTGSRHALGPDCMETVAKKLSAADVFAVSAWLAAQNMPADSKALHQKDLPKFKLPLACGSVVQ
jgi:cytochrome c553